MKTVKVFLTCLVFLVSLTVSAQKYTGGTKLLKGVELSTATPLQLDYVLEKLADTAKITVNLHEGKTHLVLDDGSGEWHEWWYYKGKWQLKNKSLPQVNADWNATGGVAQILNKPIIPAAQVNADWNATGGVAQILNKPAAYTLPVATSSILGGVKQGNKITIAADGTISANPQAWTDITGKPATFPPETHTHSTADLPSNLVTTETDQGITEILQGSNVTVSGSGKSRTISVTGISLPDKFSSTENGTGAIGSSFTGKSLTALTGINSAASPKAGDAVIFLNGYQAEITAINSPNYDGIIINVPVSTAWGAISGSLSNQTDLKTVLDSKSPFTHDHTKSQITDFAHAHTNADLPSNLVTTDGNQTISGYKKFTYDTGIKFTGGANSVGQNETSIASYIVMADTENTTVYSASTLRSNNFPSYVAKPYVIDLPGVYGAGTSAGTSSSNAGKIVITDPNTNKLPTGLLPSGIVSDSDPRLSDARTPVAHAHANADLPPYPTLSSLNGVANNDPRLSDARPATYMQMRPPTGDIHTWLDGADDGLYYTNVNGILNAPDFETWQYVGHCHFKNLYQIIIAYPTNSVSIPCFKRCINGVWSDWQHIGDGANADKVDGYHADSFAKTSDIPTSLPANGGTADYALNAGNADKVDGYHADSFMQLYKGFLTSNINANDYIAKEHSGMYQLTLGNGTGNTNFPNNTEYGRFVVISDDVFATQIIYATGNNTYIRTTYTPNAWNDCQWQRIPKISDIPSIPAYTSDATPNTLASRDANGSSSFNQVNASGGFFQQSDERLKNVSDSLDGASLSEKFRTLRKIHYVLKNDANNVEQIGMIAQELQAVCPELVTTGEDGYLAIDYAKLSVVTLSMMDSLLERIEKLESSINHQ